MKPKYSLEFRLSVVKYYLEGHGITWKNDRHTPEFKLSIVQIMLKEGLSIREATARFNISDKSVVRRWFRVYSSQGAEGLLKLKQGRSNCLN